ncbi:MAG: hypothetical protein JEZ05_03405 [Tenericutes bacterium]|nr:hypothetical protein [Mycoplasmatota bacterium]
MSRYNIMTVLIEHRRDTAEKVQALLTKYGCNIKVRLGLHEAVSVCAEDGLMVLQLVGDQGDIEALLDKLNALDGVQAKLAVFN